MLRFLKVHSLKAPSFWFNYNVPLWAQFLRGFSYVFSFLGFVRRLLKKPLHPGVPVISVGNIVMGGSGKTPTAKALALFLKQHGLRPFFLSRGYGRALKEPLWVDPSHHTYREVGDEPLLLAQIAPTLVMRHFKEVTKWIPLTKGTVLILDDGHQQTQIKSDIRLVVVDAMQGFGNGLVFPMGPLRESMKRGLKRTDFLWAINGHPPDRWQGVPVMRVKSALKTSLKRGDKVWAVAGLGYPEKFRHSLKEAGLEVVGFSIFPDHHPYQLQEISALEKKAQALKAKLVTTEKDFCRWPLGGHIPHVVALKIQVDGEELFRQLSRFNIFDAMATPLEEGK